MMKKNYKVTAEGRQELASELDGLVSRRGEIAKKIAEARDYGDLTENAEYDLAREEQGIVETRIAEIEDILNNVEIIKNGSKDKIAVGSHVDLKTGDKIVSYIVVGPIEANPLAGKISNESPIGVALCGKKVGDQVTIKTPKGESIYDIVSIQ
jgi:transcription elongation factor GreA